MINLFRSHKPTWLYESLPYLYVGAGIFATLATGNLMGIVSGSLLIAAGITVNRLRNRYRSLQEKIDLDATAGNGKLASGHAKIEEQHRILVEKANALIDAINSKESNRTINSAIEELSSSIVALTDK